MRLNTIIIAIAITGFNVSLSYADTRSSVWDKYDVESHLMKKSLAITVCMSDMALKVWDLERNNFALRFYKTCVTKIGGDQSFSKNFKNKTIDRYYYLIKRFLESAITMRA